MGRPVRTLLFWLGDQIAEHWPAIVVGMGGTLMAWLAALSAFLAPYGPVAWGAVGIVSALLIAAALWVGSLAQGRWLLNRFERRRAQALSLNPLEGNFAKQRLRLGDFFHPFYRPTSGARFEDCELLGPTP